MKHVKYRPDIDGLRAIAVLSVIGYHAFPGRVPGGFIGVDIFFVISGYLISSIIFGNLEKNSFSYKEFYMRRIKRIFPSLVLVLAVTLLFAWFVLFPHEFKQIGKHVASGIGFVSNLILWNESGYFDNASEAKPLLHLWSLGIEEQFYIIWPLLLIFAWNKKFGFLAVTSLLAVTSFVVNVVTVESSIVAAFYSPISRFWELMIGGLLAYMMLHRADIFSKNINLLSVVGVLLVAVSLVLLDESRYFPGWWALLPTLGAFLVIAAGQKAWFNRCVLSNPILVWIGLISYPLYLWHWPLLSFAHIFEYTSKEARIILVILCFALAWLTYELLEKKVRFSNDGKSVRVLLICSFIVFIAGIAAWVGVLQPRNNSYGLDLVAEAVNDSAYTDGFEPISIDGASVLKKTGSSKKVLFFGDSHMEQYAPRLKSIIEQDPDNNGTAILAFRGGCPPIPGVYEERHPECNKTFRDKVIAYALSPEVDAVVMAAWWSYLNINNKSVKGYRYYFLKDNKRLYLDEDEEGITYALESLEKLVVSITRKKNLYFVLDNPTGDEYDPQSFYSGSRITGMRDLRGRYGNYNNKDDIVLREKLIELAERANAIIVDPVKRLCNEGKCPKMLDDGTPIYRDKTHLRPFYVKQFASYMDVTLKSK